MPRRVLSDVARRWLTIYPGSCHADGTPRPPDEVLIGARARDWGWVALRRRRLADLGWFAAIAIAKASRTIAKPALPIA